MTKPLFILFAPGYIEPYQCNEFDATNLLVDRENEFTAHVYCQGITNRVWIGTNLSVKTVQAAE